jgi:hypothetical protein
LVVDDSRMLFQKYGSFVLLGPYFAKVNFHYLKKGFNGICKSKCGSRDQI